MMSIISEALAAERTANQSAITIGTEPHAYIAIENHATVCACTPAYDDEKQQSESEAQGALRSRSFRSIIYSLPSLQDRVLPVA